MRTLSNHCTLARWLQAIVVAAVLAWMPAAPSLATPLPLQTSLSNTPLHALKAHFFVAPVAGPALTIGEAARPARQAAAKLSFAAGPKGIEAAVIAAAVRLRIEDETRLALVHALQALLRARLEISPARLNHLAPFTPKVDTRLGSTGLGDRRASALRDNVQLGLVLGVLGVTLFLSLVFWAWLKKRLYAYYALYLVGLLGFFIFTPGYATPWWLGNSPYWKNYGQGLGMCLYGLAATLFVSHALDLWRHLRAAWWVGKLIALLLAGCLLASLAGHHAHLAPWPHAGVLLPLVGGLLCNVWLLRKGHRDYWIYALSFAVFGLVFGITVLGPMAWLNDWELPSLLLHGGIALHVVCLNLALANEARVTENNYRREKKKALVLAQVEKNTLQRMVALRSAQLSERNLTLQNEISHRTELQERMFTALQSESQALAVQRHFISRASHEFRTPLAVISASAQSLSMSHSADSPSVRPRIERIERATKRLGALMQRYLSDDAARTALPSGALQSILLQPWLEKIVQVLAPEADGRLLLRAIGVQDAAANGDAQGQAPCADALEPPIHVRGDPALLEIALNNLLRNALKYAPPQQPVHLSWGMVGAQVHLLVADSGPGIALQDQPHIFEKYYRPLASRHISGSGLGLFLVQQIARQHGGDVVLVSSSEEGSVFCLQLPAAQVQS